LTFDL